MKESNVKVVLTDLLSDSELTNYIIYRTLTISQGKKRASAGEGLDETMEVEAVAAEIFHPVVRLSSIDIRLLLDDAERRNTKMKKRESSVGVSDSGSRVGNCKFCGTQFIQAKTGRTKTYCSTKCRVLSHSEQSNIIGSRLR